MFPWMQGAAQQYGQNNPGMWQQLLSRQLGMAAQPMSSSPAMATPAPQQPFNPSSPPTWLQTASSMPQAAPSAAPQSGPQLGPTLGTPGNSSSMMPQPAPQSSFLAGFRPSFTPRAIMGGS